MGFAPRTPRHALSRAASPARSVRVAHSLPLVRSNYRAFCTSPSLLPAKGAEQIRKRPDARERERQVEPVVARDADRSRPRPEVELLVFDRDAAALRIVMRDDPLVQEVLVLHIEVEGVGRAER